jgi:quercetin dioxygenase-like cupin family protein
MIVRAVDKKPKEVQPNVWRSVLAYGKQLMVAEFALKQGAQVPQHAHPHEQVSYVVRGMLQFKLDGQEFVLATGESCLIPSGKTHGVEALADSVVIDTFSPPRQDFMES